MTGFRHACFISYRHPKFGLGQDFMDKLLEALRGYIEYVKMDAADPERKVFIDNSELRGGERVDPSLSEAICNSVCMIVIYTNHYFDQDSPYCAREFQAMETLEQIRRKRMQAEAGADLLEEKTSLIIPILFMLDRDKDLPKLPEEIKSRKWFDFLDYVPDKDEDILTNAKYTVMINEIARYIRDVYDRLQEWEELLIDPDCSDFSLPPVEQVKPFLEKVAPRKPKRTRMLPLSR